MKTYQRFIFTYKKRSKNKH